MRVYSKIDNNFKLVIPRGIRKALEIKPGDKLELTIFPNRVFLRSVASGCRRYTKKVATFGIGMKKASKLIVAKVSRG